MGVLIDSSVLIELERGREDSAKLIKGREDDEFFISVVTASELLHGVFRAKHASDRTRRSAFVEGVLGQFPLIDIDLMVARIHARLYSDLESKGTKIGMKDSWLAATAIAYDHTLMTFNIKDFKRVSGLKVESPG
ncbi:MAG: type II toxin-antitoxin system VapC family toxin [Chlamydiae bacterium]|nr:type II toxin-antitoxin system VapC family toxin [Chlamydiota bacterium]MBI3265546.1 type II toxin-antitoxin system VapC family toxin [Chlamydiota bacterium]